MEELFELNEKERLMGAATGVYYHGRTSLYTRDKNILIVGDGNFSFTHSLAARFGVATNIVASTLQSQDLLKTMFKDVEFHIVQSIKRGVNIRFGVDVTKMRENSDVNGRVPYDIIIFNRPHCGTHGADSDPNVIRENQLLLDDFFSSSCPMIHPVTGEIHVSIKTNWPYNLWNIEKIAREHGLVVIKKVRFPLWEYPFYVNKKASGDFPDNTFCNRCTVTYVFGMKKP
ncbi:hypothetical protein Hdeb2414_s0002g00051931 [Helianthus debilis subsp. tardiflorus]